MTTSLKGGRVGGRHDRLRAFEAQTPEFDRLIQRLASAVCRAPLVGFPAPEAAPLASREAFQGRGGWKKIFKPPKPERGRSSHML